MQRRRIGHFGIMITSVWMLTVGTASGQECSNADFSGRYAVSTQNYNASGIQVGANLGTLHVDGAGTILEWKQTTIDFAADGGEPTVRETDFGALIASSGNTMLYTVGADCRVTMSGDFGGFVLGGVATLGDGGKEVVFQQTTSPNGVRAHGTFRSVEPSASDELAEIKALLDRIAIRNGLLP